MKAVDDLTGVRSHRVYCFLLEKCTNFERGGAGKHKWRMSGGAWWSHREKRAARRIAREEFNPGRLLRRKMWREPAVGMFRVDVDSYGVGVVLRNCNGDLVAALTKPSCVLEPEIIASEFLWRGISTTGGDKAFYCMSQFH